MYYPQSYHHVQEIQKYNIQDYRPRYVSHQSSYILRSKLTCLFTGWNSSKRQSARSVKSSECANNVVTPSPRQTKVKLVYCKHMTQQESEAGMEKWPRRREVDLLAAVRRAGAVVMAEWVCCVMQATAASKVRVTIRKNAYLDFCSLYLFQLCCRCILSMTILFKIHDLES